jgi:hypothetical protein
LQYLGPAVALQFDDMFAGEGMRRGKPQGDAVVESFPLPIQEAGVGGMARRQGTADKALTKGSGSGLEMRTTPMPPRPGAVAMAAMGSELKDGMGADQTRMSS